MNITMLSPRTLLLTPLTLLAVLALAALALLASPTAGQAQGTCADPNDTSCPFGVTPSATHESITVAWVDQLDGANKWQIEVGVEDRSHLINIEDTIVWSGGSSRIEERTVTPEDVGIAKTVSASYQCEDTYVTEEHVGKYMAVCIETPPTARVTKSANPFTITNATWPELSIRPETDHTVRMRAFRDDHEGYIVARSGWSTSHTVRTKEEPQPQEGGQLAPPTDAQVKWVRHAGSGRWNLHMTWTATTSAPASSGRVIEYEQSIYQRGDWEEYSPDCFPGEDGGTGFVDHHQQSLDDTGHIFCASNVEVDLAPGLHIQLRTVEKDGNGRSTRHSSWVEVKAPAYEDHWYQVRNVKSVVTNDYARITWDPPRVTSGASKFLDSFFSVPRRVSYDILVKTAGGTRTEDGTACGSGAHVHFDSRYGRVVTVRKGTLQPGCKYVAEIEALYSSAITGIPAILGVDAAPGKQLSKGSTRHGFSFTEPQRDLVLKVDGKEQDDGAQVDVSEGSKVTLTADVGGAAPDHGLRINLVATGTAGSLAGCSTGTGHDWGPGLNCAGGTETANLHIAGGQNSASIDIKFHQDAQEDPGETLTLTASYVIRGESDSHSVTFNIEDIYHANKLSVQSSSAHEPEPEAGTYPSGTDSTRPVKFLVVLQRSTQETVTVKYATADGYGDIVGGDNPPATGRAECMDDPMDNNNPNRDYVSTSGTLTFGPGETRKYIHVEVCDDTIPDSMEVFRMVLSEATNAMITHPKAIGLIINDEAPANVAPTVASAIPDAIIPSQSATRQVSLSGVFTDADGDTLTTTAKSSDTAITTVEVATDQSSLTVTAKARGTATITVTAADGKGGSVEDSFAVTVKAAPVVASAIADVGELGIGATQEISLSDVFSDADGDALTINATSSDSTVVQVSNTIDPSTGSATALTVIGVDDGTATITVTARDSDGNSVNDTFDVTVAAAEQQQQAPELPGPVSGLTVTASATADSVSVSWNAPETGGAPQGYIAHIKPEGGKQGSGTTKRPGADITTVNFNNLASGRTYEVWVRAHNEAGKGERVHGSITLEQQQRAVEPGPVVDLQLSAAADSVTVSWSAPETGGAPDNYIVHIKPEDGGKGKTKMPKANKTSVTFKNLDAGRTYEVWVRAENDAGKGDRVRASITLPQAEPQPEESQGDGQQ